MIDIIVPTLRTREEVAPLIAEIEANAGIACRVFATCQPVSAAANRNAGLDWARSEIVLQIDDDISDLPPGFGLGLMQTLRETPHCVMASARLMHPRGGYGLMAGRPELKESGLSRALDRHLPTACVAIWRQPLRFNEMFHGSGWEDRGYAMECIARDPMAVFLVANEIQVLHKNEKKHQMENWAENKSYYEEKYGRVG